MDNAIFAILTNRDGQTVVTLTAQLEWQDITATGRQIRKALKSLMAAGLVSRTSGPLGVRYWQAA